MKKYDVTVQTPLGLMHGNMRVESAGNTVRGTLSLMGYTEPFAGSVDTDGICRISGTVSTLLFRFEYTATGRITPEQVSFDVQSGEKVFQLVGTAEH